MISGSASAPGDFTRMKRNSHAVDLGLELRQALPPRLDPPESHSRSSSNARSSAALRSSVASPEPGLRPALLLGHRVASMRQRRSSIFCSCGISTPEGLYLASGLDADADDDLLFFETATPLRGNPKSDRAA